MKKVLFSVLMIAAMFMVAACGSGKLEFADPAIVYGEGVDVTSCFSPVSVSELTITSDEEFLTNYFLVTNVKLKVDKKPILKQTAEAKDHLFPDLHQPFISLHFRFLDESGTLIEEYLETLNVKKLAEGSIRSFDIHLGKASATTKESLEEKMAKIKKVEVEISTENAEL